MFDSLSDRLQGVFRSLRGEARLTEQTVEAALREIRMALLEADVNFKVVKAFIDRVRDRAVDQEVLKSLTPAQQVVRIVRDEMLALFGDTQGGLPASQARPRVILLLGLQGSGKTTTTGKLARWLGKQGRHPLLVSTDVRRPAAIEQLSVVGKQAGVRVHDAPGEMDPVKRASGALTEARNAGFDVVIVDTAGRLQDLEPFHPDRVVSRVLGMGDVLSLIEKAEEAVSQEDAEKLERKIRLDEFTLEDFRDQLRTIKKMGPLEQILGMLPGMGGLKEMAAARDQVDDKQLGRVEAIINSMTQKERRNHQLINGQRRKRIARGSGTSVEEVNKLLKQFIQMKKMLKQLGGMAGLGKKKGGLGMMKSLMNR